MAEDIRRLVDACHSCLVTSPSIHFLIPHLCPRNSATKQVFARYTKRLRITGSLNRDEWSDRSTCHLFSTDASSVACSSRFFVAALSGCDVEEYKNTAFGISEYVGRLNQWLFHGRQLLAFSRSPAILATCCHNNLRTWNLQNLKDTQESQFDFLWCEELDFGPCDMSFSQDERLLVVANEKDGSVVKIDATTGSRRGSMVLREHEKCLLSGSAAEHTRDAPGFAGICLRSPADSQQRAPGLVASPSGI